MAPVELKAATSNVWVTWWDSYLSNSNCFRARALCWIGSMIVGIGPVFTNKKNVSHGSYPVYFDEQVFKAPNATSSFIKICASLFDGTTSNFHQTRLLKVTKRFHAYVQQSHWSYSLQCSCQPPNTTNTSGSYHHVRDCLGPILRSGIPSSQDCGSAETCEQFVRSCRALALEHQRK